MGTLSGKPANPVDLSDYASRRASEGVGGERRPVEDDRDAFRSPYAPKEAWRRAAANADASPDLAAGTRDTSTNAAPLAPVRAPDGLREPLGRHAVDLDESRLYPDEAPDSGWPGSEDHDRRQHSALSAAASLRSSDPADSGRHEQASTAHRDALDRDAPNGDSFNRDSLMTDRELERLETSLRWLQRQESATRLPPAPTLPPGPGLDAVGRRHGGDRFAGDFRSPLSLEPERMVPPPALTAGNGNLRWSIGLFVASVVVAGSAYYLSSSGSAPQPEPAARQQLAAAVATPASPSAVSPVRPESVARPEPVGRQDTVARKDTVARQESRPTVARDDDPEVLRDNSAQSTRTLKTAKLSAKLPEETVAKSPPATGGAQQSPPASNPAPVRTLDAEQIALLTKQGEQFVAAGDLVTARMVFQRAAEAGDAYAAMALGATYDPGVLAKLGVVGMSSDVEKARSWYQKAESLGSPEAAKRLSVLANR